LDVELATLQANRAQFGHPCALDAYDYLGIWLALVKVRCFTESNVGWKITSAIESQAGRVKRHPIHDFAVDGGDSIVRPQAGNLRGASGEYVLNANPCRIR